MGRRLTSEERGRISRSMELSGIRSYQVAAAVGVEKSVMSRYLGGEREVPSSVISKLEQVLKVSLDASAEAELYVSSPVTALPEAVLQQHHDDVASIVAALSALSIRTYWPGRDLLSHDQRGSPDVDAERNLPQLASCRGFLFLQFSETSRSSGALVELGMALGMKKHVTIIHLAGLQLPYLVEGLDIVSGELRFLPGVRSYSSDRSVDDVLRRVTNTGRPLFRI